MSIITKERQRIKSGTVPEISNIWNTLIFESGEEEKVEILSAVCLRKQIQRYSL